MPGTAKMNDLTLCADCADGRPEDQLITCDACPRKICDACVHTLTTSDGDTHKLCAKCADAPWGLRNNYASLLRDLKAAIDLLNEDKEPLDILSQVRGYLQTSYNQHKE